MQEDVGLQSATDGEFRRTSWHMDFIYQLDGISKAEDDLDVHFHNPEGEHRLHARRRSRSPADRPPQPIFGDAFEFLRDTVDDGATPKLTIPSPSMVHYRGGAAAIDPASTPTRTSSGPT